MVPNFTLIILLIEDVRENCDGISVFSAHVAGQYGEHLQIGNLNTLDLTNKLIGIYSLS